MKPRLIIGCQLSSEHDNMSCYYMIKTHVTCKKEQKTQGKLTILWPNASTKLPTQVARISRVHATQ